MLKPLPVPCGAALRGGSLQASGVASSLRAAQMEVQIFDGGRVVQTKPAIGSEQKIRHTFIPPAMLPVVRAFMALPGAATFTLDQLHAPDAFLKVCAVRQLMALHAVVFLGKEESKRWRRRRDFQEVDLRGVLG